jgi:antitoxin (DNA-binding transcriptional repressor) of toxin-antitoxin stability system
MVKSAYRARSTPRSTSVTATEAAKNFGALVDRVREAGAAYVVERQGRAIARISPITERRCTLAMLARWFDDRTVVPGEYAAAVVDHVRASNRARVPKARWQP